MSGPMTNPLDMEEIIRRRGAAGLGPGGAGVPAANMDAAPDVVNAMAGNRNAAALRQPTPSAQPSFWSRFGAALGGHLAGSPAPASAAAPSVEQAQRNFETYQTDDARDALQQAQQSQDAAEQQRRQQFGAALLKSSAAGALRRIYAALGGAPRRTR